MSGVLLFVFLEAMVCLFGAVMVIISERKGRK